MTEKTRKTIETRLKRGTMYSSVLEKLASKKFDDYKGNAKRRDKLFSLNKQEFFRIVLSNCFYCGKDNAMGVDRIDSEVGYVIENCVPCCKYCNYAKNDMSTEDFLNHVKKIYEHLIKN